LPPLPLAGIFEDIPDISVQAATYTTKIIIETLHLDAASQNMTYSFNYFFFPMTQQPLVGQGLLIIEASRSHSFRHTTLGRTPLDE
jgi:hypothetical protein